MGYTSDDDIRNRPASNRLLARTGDDVAPANDPGQGYVDQPGMDLSGKPYAPGMDPTANKTPPGYAQSEAALTAQSARRPVTSNVEQAGPPDPRGYFGQPPGTFGFEPIANAAKSLFTPTPVNISGTPRPSGQAYGMNDRGAGTDNIGRVQPAAAAAAAPAAEPAQQAGLTTEQVNTNARAKLDIMNAADRQRQENFVNFDAARAREEAMRPDSREIERARSEARVANFRATDGADMILAPNNPGYAQQRNRIVQNAAEANQRANGMEVARALPSAVAPQGSNFVQNAAAAQAAGQSAQDSDQKQKLSDSLLKRGALEQQGLGLDNEGKKAHMAAVSELQAAGDDPHKQAAAERKLLALAGKTEPGWKAVVIPGGFDPDTGGQRASSVLYYNQFTQQSQLMGGQGESLAGGKPQAKPPAVGEVRDGHRFKGGNPGDQANWTKV